MKKFLLKTLSLITAVSMPAVYSTGYETLVSAVGEEENNFSLSFPEFSYITGQDDGKPTPVAHGTQYHGTMGRSGTAAMPSSFDMREYGTISSVKNQGSYGTCWAHSSAASAESSVIASEPSVNLSELHTAYYSYYGDDEIKTSAMNLSEHLNWGGSSEIVANLWSQWIGPVYESRLPYDNTSFFEVSDEVDDMRYTSDYHLENAYLFDFNNDRSNANDINNLVKQFVYNGNAVDVSFYHEASISYNADFNCVNSNKLPKFANHAVTIAGWDDNFPAENFSIQPEHDGAWLVKNSWNYSFGDDGYMWISYDDKTLSSFAVYELGDKDNYSVNYQHDSFVPSQLLCAQTNGQEENFSYMANIFTAEYDMDIEAVSTYFQNAGTDYEVTIYSGLTDETNPTSAEPSAVTSGYDALTGYRTIELSESVPVKAGEKFGVVVKLSNEESPYIIPVESSLFIKDSTTDEITDINKYSTAEQIETYTAQNQSFYSADGVNWSDTYGETQAYTDEEKAVMLEMLREELYAGVEDDTPEFYQTEQLYTYYEELFSTGDLFITVGNISLKAFGNPSGNVKFSHISGEVPADEAVSLSGDGDIFVSVNDSEYVPYTEPVKITEDTKISAYTDPMYISERTYKPAQADFISLQYTASNSGIAFAEKVSDNEYVIELSVIDSTLQFYPETTAQITMDGKKINPYEYTEPIDMSYGKTDITFELEEPGKLSKTITVRLAKPPVEFMLDKEIIEFQPEFTVTAEDGRQFESGDSVSDYAGQTLTAVSNEVSEVYVVDVPKRVELPELEYDYYYETLGFIPNETAALLEYSVVEEPSYKDYVSPQKRLVDGTWINSGMVMNKAFKVIPGEKIIFKISAGNGMFASEPVTYEIPSAVSAPEEMPEFTKKDGKYYLSGYDYEIAPLNNPLNEDAISVLAENMGYSDVRQYRSLMVKRYGIDVQNAGNFTAVLGAEWGTDYAIEGGQTVAVRKAATDNQFASQCVFITVGEATEKGDINGDGFVDAVDSTLVLVHYASMSTDGTGTISEEKLSAADYNDDGFIDAVDATAILMYYAEMSTIQNE